MQLSNSRLCWTVITPVNEVSLVYDNMYEHPNYFGDRRWLYRPFIRALIRRTGLGPGTHLLDAGCGQGFFSALFAEQGINVTGVDISKVGIQTARSSYNLPLTNFETGDILNLPYKKAYDCVFTRSCSLYNRIDFPINLLVTDKLLSYVCDEGVLIFDYYTKLSDRKHAEHWIYHSLEDAKQHFSRYRFADVYFSVRLDCLLFGRFAFSSANTFMAQLLSRSTGVGGELVALVRPNREVDEHS